MATKTNKKVIETFFDAGNRGDMETCFGLIADDVVWQNIGSTVLSGTFRGKEDLMQNLLGPLFGRLKAGIHMEVHQLIAEGDRVVAVCSGRAETLDGQPYNNEYCWIIRIRDGQIAELTEFLDTDLARRVFD